MASLLVPAPTEAQILTVSTLPDSPFQRLVGLSRSQWPTPGTARRRAPPADRALRRAPATGTRSARNCPSGCRPGRGARLAAPPLPLVLSLAAARRHSLGRRPGRAGRLRSGAAPVRLQAWRPILGQRFLSQFGPPPFDPVSLGLAGLLARWRNWTWPQLLTELASPERGAGYCRRLGFDPHDLPACSTLRTAWGDPGRSLVPAVPGQSGLGLMALGLIPSHSTFPDDPPERGVSVATDSQLLAARSHMRCRHQNAACFAPCPNAPVPPRPTARTAVPVIPTPAKTPVVTPPTATRRPPTSTTPARTSPAHTRTRIATSKSTPKGKHHFGYKAKAFAILDDRLFTYWPLSGPFVPANRNDHLQTIPGFQDLAAPLPGPGDWRSHRRCRRRLR